MLRVQLHIESSHHFSEHGLEFHLSETSADLNIKCNHMIIYIIYIIKIKIGRKIQSIAKFTQLRGPIPNGKKVGDQEVLEGEERNLKQSDIQG